jgi:alanine dehydrogenase
MYSLNIVDGDLVVDSRGKFVTTEGTQKVSNQVNYALRTSAYLRAILNNSSQRSYSNAMAIRDAINKTINDILVAHSKNPSLPLNERLKSIKQLEIVEINPTDFEFFIELETYSKQTVPISIGGTF